MSSLQADAACSCGSGAKYKQCCLSKGSLENRCSEHVRTTTRLIADLASFAQAKLGQSIDQAWQDFGWVNHARELEDSGETALFLLYLLSRWDPHRKRRVGEGGILLRWYRIERRYQLSQAEHRILDEAQNRPVSFYEILRRTAGQRLILRDLLLGKELEVLDQNGSSEWVGRDIVYAQLWHFEHFTTFGFRGDACLPPWIAPEIAGLRKKLRMKSAGCKRALTGEDLLLFEEEIRSRYFKARDLLLSPLVLRTCL